MIRAVAWTAAMLAAALPTVADAATAHSGVIGHRSAPELSDIALAIFAVAAVWFVRRALRDRFRRDRIEERGEG